MADDLRSVELVTAAMILRAQAEALDAAAATIDHYGPHAVSRDAVIDTFTVDLDEATAHASGEYRK